MEFIMLCGLPASGKSTFVSENNKDGKFIYLSTDKIRWKHNLDFTSAGLMKTFAILTRLMNKALKNGEDIIFEATNLTVSTRKQFFKALAAYERYTTTCVYFDTPIDECIRRNALRPDDVRVPIEKMNQFNKQLVIPTKAEGWDKIIIVSNTTTTVEV